MKRFLPFFLIFFLAACGGKISAIEGLTLVDEAIERSARQTSVMLDQGQITPKQACKISTYGRFAHEAVVEGYTQWVLGNPSAATDHLTSAQNALAGLTPDVLAAVEKDC